MLKQIPYARQSISEDDIAEVVRVLRSDFLTQGPTVEAFELAVSEYCGVKYAVAVSSATAALHLACLALGLRAGDRLWTTPNTFVASANCALYCGASIDFVDIDPQTLNMSADALEARLIDAKSKGLLPSIVLPVHFAGRSAPMARFDELSRIYGFRLVEDASHALGGRYGGKKVGSCEHSSCAIFSFHAVKNVTTGEGGMVVTNDPRLADEVRRLRTHGITRDPVLMASDSDGPWYYEQVELGFNYRMTDIQAALGISQMRRLDQFMKRRNEIAAHYATRLKSLPLALPSIPEDDLCSFHLYVVRLKLSELSKTHRQVFEELRARDIYVNLHYIPVYRHPHYQKLGFKAGHCPESERYYKEAISLPVFPSLTESDQDLVVKALESVLGAGSGKA